MDVIIGTRNLVLALREYVIRYNRHRPHQYRRQRPPDIKTGHRSNGQVGLKSDPPLCSAISVRCLFLRHMRRRM